MTESGRARIEDRSDDVERNYGELVVREADAFGLKTTLGTGQALRYSEGNSVTTLMDRDAFVYAAAMMRFARREILTSQLFFAVPKQFENLPVGRGAEPDLRLRSARPDRSEHSVPASDSCRRSAAGTRARAVRPARRGRAHPAACLHGAAVRQDFGRGPGLPLLRPGSRRRRVRPARRRPLHRHRRAEAVLRAGERPEPEGRGVRAAGAQFRRPARQADDDGPGPHAQHRLAVQPELRRSPGSRHRRLDSRRRDRVPETRRRVRDDRPREGRLPRDHAPVLERCRRPGRPAAGGDEGPGQSADHAAARRVVRARLAGRRRLRRSARAHAQLQSVRRQPQRREGHHRGVPARYCGGAGFHLPRKPVRHQRRHRATRWSMPC